MTQVNASCEESNFHPGEISSMSLVKMKEASGIKLAPVKVVAGSGDKPMTQVNASCEESKFHLGEISSMISVKMKEVSGIALTPVKVVAGSGDKPMTQGNAKAGLMRSCSR